MNKKLSMAVAAALAMGASAAQAGITIPAGDWTIDIGGNVNAYYIHNNSGDSNTITGGLANTKSTGSAGSSASSINTGLLPSWLGITGKKRENNLDVSWTISFQPGASSNDALSGGSGSEFRQASMTFGDKSWGSIKIGKDLGMFGADAILNDMTLLGVGSQGVVGAQGGTTTTLGRIGTGFLYADFKGQINYTSPNMNGFQFSAGIAQPWSEQGTTDNQKHPGYEGVVSYSWAGDFSGKVWAEGFRQRVDGLGTSNTVDDIASVVGAGVKLSFGGIDLVGYYYDGEGVGTTALLMNGFTSAGVQRDSDGGYVQAAYTLPSKTKLAISWGESNLELANAETNAALVKTNEMASVGIYHPLTSNLNLVVEYNKVESESQGGLSNTSNVFALGAILFF